MPFGLHKACMPMYWHNAVKSSESNCNVYAENKCERETTNEIHKIECRKASSPKTCSVEMVRCIAMCNNFSPRLLHHRSQVAAVFCCGIFLFPNWLSMISKCICIVCGAPSWNWNNLIGGHGHTHTSRCIIMCALLVRSPHTLTHTLLLLHNCIQWMRLTVDKWRRMDFP